MIKKDGLQHELRIAFGQFKWINEETKKSYTKRQKEWQNQMKDWKKQKDFYKEYQNKYENEQQMWDRLLVWAKSKGFKGQVSRNLLNTTMLGHFLTNEPNNYESSE